MHKITTQGSQQEARISVTVPEIGGIQAFVFEFVKVKCEILYLCLDLPYILKQAYFMNFVLTYRDANFLLSRIWAPNSPYKPIIRITLSRDIRVCDFFEFVETYSNENWYDGV